MTDRWEWTCIVYAGVRRGGDRTVSCWYWWPDDRKDVCGTPWYTAELCLNHSVGGVYEVKAVVDHRRCVIVRWELPLDIVFVRMYEGSEVGLWDRQHRDSLGLKGHL